MKSIAIVDLGTGNLRSVSKAVSFVSPGSNVIVTADANEITDADHLILPGQGAIGTWFDQLRCGAALKQAVGLRLADGPVLGICLGLQALYRRSEENEGTECLGILKGEVKHFSGHRRHRKSGGGSKYKIPHMGWNNISIVNDHPLWHGVMDGERFYFVHSYYVDGEEKNEIAGECEYGNKFTAAAASGNLFATQFHPEKSQQAGLRLLKNFTDWDGRL